MCILKNGGGIAGILRYAKITEVLYADRSKGKRPKELNPAQTQIYNINGTVIKVEPKFRETGKTLFSSLGRMIFKDFKQS